MLTKLRAELLSQMQNQVVVEHDLRAFFGTTVAVRDSAAIWDVPSLAVEALRSVVSGMQADTDAHDETALARECLDIIKQPAGNSLPPKFRQHVEVLDLG
jgi:hypothetical protein